jgi:multidrug efflux pump subunit AcrB
VQYSSSFGAVKRKNLDKLVVVSSGILEGYNANEIVAQIKNMLASYKMKEGYNYRFGGEQEEQAKSMAFLSRALLIALAAVFMIIVWQFNSAVRPAIIMVSVLFSTIGVFLGLAIFKMDFIIIMTGIGIISLAGVVVNNAIVLIDYTDLLKNRKLAEQGLSEEDDLDDESFVDALVEAGFTRLRPVLLTAITTVLGLIPLATGMNIDFFMLFAKFDPDFYIGGDNAIFWGPMAWTVIFGLTFATFLTLVIVPVMYLLTDKMMKGFKRLFNAK